MPQPITGASIGVSRQSQTAHLGFSNQPRGTYPATDDTPPPPQTAWTVRRTRPVDQSNAQSTERQPERSDVVRRRYDIQWLAQNGDIRDAPVAAPALPVFEAAFNAFARGALIPTVQGLVAIEDLMPGDLVETVEGDVQPVDWIGSMVLDTQGNHAPDAKPERLYRIAADTFGWGRPSPDLVVGAGARYLHRADALKSYLGTNTALAPFPSLVDGVSVIEITPISAVRCYHLGLRQHRLIRVNGVELESYHPGTAASGQLSGALRTQFMALFPHLDGLGSFGATAYPRLSSSDMIMLQSK